MNADKALELARLAYPNDENLRVAYMLGLNAGAEWMAGQGYTVDGIVICDKELTRGYKDIVMSIPDELKIDDKVTIQIRKKED